ncbi:TnsA endonuclease N-terminal domain-containing protein [Pseudomonas sp. CCOS 191]|uniref:TnsA endonuclease N-terminal domain-containing protein n=1 Tax=Pseudomonas sp. CCOS 191 TaxID=1649877 RepID=UPI0018E68A31|nr:TnsA endonuclease N-terminal domain-containing protein [Pseudomonas sp. CCOS 191]MBI6951877.1 hypothetical protein [Pseudomonas sp. CCOS 191]
MINDGNGPNFSRDVTRRTNRGRRALAYFSRKNHSTEIRVESGLEKELGLLLEADPRVISYRAQPFSLELESNTVLNDKSAYKKKAGVKPRFYTPDFVCRLANGALLAIEVKGNRFLKEFNPCVEDIAQCLRGHGMNFLVVPENQIDETAVKNITRLHVLRANYQDDYVEGCSQAVSQAIAGQSEWELECLSRLLNEGKAAVLCALLTGVLTTDLRTCLFSETATVAAGYGDLRHFEILEIV